MKTFLFVCWLLLCALSPGQATTYYVSTGGSDGNSCATAQTCTSTTCSTAKGTIAGGKSCIAAGDTLYIREGTYTTAPMTWTSPSGSVGQPIVIAGYPDDAQPVWDVSSSAQHIGIWFWDVTHLTFQGITFDGTNGANGLVPDYTSTSVTFLETIIKLDCAMQETQTGCTQNLLFEGNTFRNASYGYVIAVPGAGTNTFRANDVLNICKVSNCNPAYIESSNNVFEDNTYTDLGGPAIAFWNQSGATADDNIARNNFILRAGWFWAATNGTDACYSPAAQNTSNGRSPAIFVAKGDNALVYNNVVIDSPGGIFAGYSATNCKVYNNTIYGNTYNLSDTCGSNDLNAGIAFDAISGGSTGCIARNNIVAHQNGVQPISNTGASLTFSNNLCDASDAQCATVDATIGFANVSTNNFHLTAGSDTAIDVGFDLSAVFASDFDDVTRPQGSAFDLGAFEFVAGLVFLADPSGLSLSGNTALTLLGNPSALSLSGNAALTPLGNPSGLSLSGNSALTFLNNPSGLTLP